MIPATVFYSIVPCVATLVLYIIMAALVSRCKLRSRLLRSFLPFASQAQTDSTKNLNDTAILEPVTVMSFGGSANWKDAPVSVALINKTQLQRFDNKTLLPVFNTITGVRMEERSPGSYRLSIRGS